MNRHLVTGATGFIGAVLLLELLEQSDDRAVCLVRGRDGSSAEERLQSAIAHAANVYGCPELIPEAEERLEAVDADLADLRVEPSAIGRIGTVWHVAASLNFSDAQSEETFQQNVEGTVRLADLAAAAGGREFVYFSTAYVAGQATGDIAEQQAGPQPPANNPYEESKRRAEAHLLGRGDLRVRVMRPSMVIGHSRTYGALTSAGMYSMLDGLSMLGRYAERELGRAMLVIADGGSPQNLIPVDAVARNAWLIHRSTSTAKIFHLVNGTPPTLDDVAEALTAVLGLEHGVDFVDSREGMSDFERLFADHPRNAMYEPYLTKRRYFELTNTDAIVGPEASRFDLGPEGLQPYIAWHFENAADGVARS